MKLTRRQEEFVNHLYDLNRELDRPIHYSVLAERLGVSPFTAYDMLCLLEEKGLATSEYQLASDKSGPGRAERVFCPTIEAQARRQHLLEKASNHARNIIGSQEFFQDRISSREIPHNELAEEFLFHFPPEVHKEGVRYCIELMTIIAFRLLRSSGRSLFVQTWAKIIPQKADFIPSNFSLLGGLLFGLLVRECTHDPECVEMLIEHVYQYLEIIGQLSPEDCDQLGNFLWDLNTLITEEETTT